MCTGICARGSQVGLQLVFASRIASALRWALSFHVVGFRDDSMIERLRLVNATIACNGSIRDRPTGLSSYSTFGGMVAWAMHVARPSASSFSKMRCCAFLRPDLIANTLLSSKSELVVEIKFKSTRPGRRSGASGTAGLPTVRRPTSTGTLVDDGAMLLYRASKRDCDDCSSSVQPQSCATSATSPNSQDGSRRYYTGGGARGHRRCREQTRAYRLGHYAARRHFPRTVVR